MENKLERSNQISKSSQPAGRVLKIMDALTEVHCYRGAQMNEMYLNLMSARLAQEDLARVFRALKDLGERPRKDGESALLDLGTILGEMNSKPRILSAPGSAA